MRLGVVWIMLTSLLPSLFAQGVLVIEISDTLNAPLTNLSVRIRNEKGEIQTLRTDSEGRVRDDAFPVGNYTYSFYYGDLNTGSFTIESGKPTWVNLDYRRVGINFKDEKGLPSSGNFVTLYRRESDGTRTLVGQKTSNENGAVLFVVPEGNYTYVAADGEHNIVVKDKNINTSVSVSSKLVTYKTSFQFVKGGKPISVYARDISVRQIVNGSSSDFGVVLAHGETQASSYIEYEKTDGKISCPIGEYEYSVYTRDYGVLTGSFFVTQQNSQTNNVVKIEIPEKEPEQELLTPDTEKELVNLSIHVVNCEDTTPVRNLACRYAVPGSSSKYTTTDENGLGVFQVNPGTYSVSIPSETKSNVVVSKDTTIEFCINLKPVDPEDPDSSDNEDPVFQQVYFQFFYKGAEVFPQTIDRISVSKIEGGRYLNYGTMLPTKDSVSNLNKFSQPILTTEGRYYFSFPMNEYNSTYYSNNFNTSKDKAVDTVKIEFEEKYKLEIFVLRHDSTKANGEFAVSYIDKYKTTKRTNDEGYLSLLLNKGSFTFSAIDQEKSLELTKDTTLYFFIPENHTQNVYFKFLHDGEIVYPSVMNLTFYKKDILNPQYAYISSTEYTNYEGLGHKFVFDKPVELPTDTFIASYYINDYDYDGQMYHKFTTNAMSENDTLIYIVVPVKRTVELQIKDANGSNVQGVFATIYKYNEEGELMTDTDYDGNTHTRLMSDATGIVRDHLVPGRYQIRILDIVRDFEVSDYDLRFTILSDVDMFNVKFIVLYSDDRTPVQGMKLDVKKGNEFYNNGITNDLGEIKFQSEAANYSYTLYYGNGLTGNYKIVDKDETIEILVDRPVLVSSIALIGGEQCLKFGESTKFTPIINPSNATQKNLDWTIDNTIIAKVASDGTLTANTIGISGTVTLTAKAKDESGVTASVVITIGDGDCYRAYTLAFGDGSTEMLLDDYTFDLVATPAINKYTYYAYQTSQDGVNWVTAADITEMNTVTLNAEKYMEGTHLFRAIGADDAYSLLNMLDGITEITDENLTNIIILRNPERNGQPIADKIEIPTVFTPHEVNGANDDFMPGYPVVIYNRFGDVICKSDNGWNGKYKGETADAGVYIYVLTLKDGKEVKGTIQLYRK